jgi:carbon-monoxide dehydrogenase small subunit
MERAAIPIVLRVNGECHELTVSPLRTLLEVLREDLLLTGSKCGCNQGVCGACTVLRDGEPICACLALAVNTTECEITTIEGLGDSDDPSPVQRAFVEAGAVQCGFCMPGMIIAATALIRETPRPSPAEIRDALSGNLCRCSGYVKIVDAVSRAADLVGRGGEVQ